MRIFATKVPLPRRGRGFFLSLCAALATLLCSCNAEDQYSSSYYCHFVFYTQHHPTSALATVTANPGNFVRVSVTKKNGVNHIAVSNNYNSTTEDIALTSEIENNRITYSLGANNALLIGCTTTMEPRAYDGQCPYCLENGSSTNYPLTWGTDKQTVACKRCGRTFGLNYNGACTSSPDGGASPSLLQYRVGNSTGYDGTEVLVVNN